MSRTALRLFALAACSALSLSARGAAPKKTPALLENGRARFAVSCAPCHGRTGAGDGELAANLAIKPRDFTKEKFKHGAKVTNVFDVLAKGLEGTPMVAFGHLSEEERWALSWWVLELKEGRGGAGR